MKIDSFVRRTATTQMRIGVVCLVLILGCESKSTPLPDGSGSGTAQADPGKTEDPDHTKHPGASEGLDESDGLGDPRPGVPSAPKDGDNVSWDGEAKSLIPAGSMEDWEAIEFGGEGDCRVEKGVMVIESGERMTGVSLGRDDLPKTNFEISMETRRVDGIDFFCGLTFPVDDSHCTLIVGGWAGATVGLSCIDELDASSNETCKYMSFETNQWYRIRVRVLPEKIVVWIDDEEVISQTLEGHVISLRSETIPCRPLGLCTFQTTSETRELKIRKINPLAKDDE